MKGFRKGNKKGFTLVEIMAVTAIIGMMTALSVPNFLRMKIDSNESAAQENLRSLYTLIEDYRFANGSYPTGATQLTDFVDTYYKKHSVISNPTSDYWMFHGYRYDYRQPSSGIWEWIAIPDAVNVTGNRFFVMNESGALKEVDANYALTNFEGSHSADPIITDRRDRGPLPVPSD